MPRAARTDTVSVWGPNREWWVFNPGPRLDICLAEGIYDFVYHQKTYQFKPNMRISPERHLTQLGANFPWRVILLDYHEDVALKYEHDTGWDRPTGVFPVWSAQTETSKLVKLLERYPEPGDKVGWFTGADTEALAIEGQEQRVILCNFPTSPLAWEPIFRDLMSVKRDFPHITFHFNGQKTIARTLATGVDSFDHPVTLAWEGEQPVLLLASGQQLAQRNEKKIDYGKWARLVGVRPHSIFDESDRTKKSRRMYMFNLRSLKWSFANYHTVWSMKVVDESMVDTNDPDSEWIPVDVRYRPRAEDTTDKWICDLCSISNRCPFFRPGAICAVDDTEAASLAGKFKTRNSFDIIEGLGILVGAQSERAKNALKLEQRHNDEHPDEARFSPEVTRMLTAVFDQGVTLARLVDPALGTAQPAGRRNRNVIDATVANAVASASPQQLAAGIAREIDAAGYSLQDLTPEQAAQVLANSIPSGTLVSHDDDGADADDDAGRTPMASLAPSFRAAPSFNPGVPGTDVP